MFNICYLQVCGLTVKTTKINIFKETICLLYDWNIGIPMTIDFQLSNKMMFHIC